MTPDSVVRRARRALEQEWPASVPRAHPTTPVPAAASSPIVPVPTRAPTKRRAYVRPAVLAIRVERARLA